MAKRQCKQTDDNSDTYTIYLFLFPQEMLELGGINILIQQICPMAFHHTKTQTPTVIWPQAVFQWHLSPLCNHCTPDQQPSCRSWSTAGAFRALVALSAQNAFSLLSLFRSLFKYYFLRKKNSRSLYLMQNCHCPLP